MNLTPTAPGLAVEVNGEPRTIPAESSVHDLLVAMGIDPAESGIAVARNLRIVRRDDWQATRLAEGDTVEVVTATQGG